MHHTLITTRALGRAIGRTFNNSEIRRCHHSAIGKLTTISPQGTLITRPIEVWVGDLESTYVMFSPEISCAFQAQSTLRSECSTADPELFPLHFYHDTRHFSPKSSSFPRLEIDQDLPQQSSSNSSPATLHSYGVTHAITLDGTPDAGFQHSMRESLQRLKPVLDQLKDT